VVAVVQSLELDQDLLAQLFILLEGYFLERDDLLGRLVNRFFDQATRTLAKLLVRDEVCDAH